MPSGGVHKLVDSWQWEEILWAGFIEVCIIDTNPLFSVRFLYHHHIGQPLGIMGFPNELSLEELADLLANRRVPLGVESAALLNDKLVGQIYIEPVDDDRRINVGNLFM